MTTNTSSPALPNLIAHCAPIAEHYLTLKRVHPSKTYNYAKKNHFDLPVIELEQYGPKCGKGESWTYFAVPAGAHLAALGPGERLYVGAQTQDRMFRGDDQGSKNYHHAEMRSGNDSDTPVTFLRAGREIAIYRVRSQVVADLVTRDPELAPLRQLLVQRRCAKRHLGWWFEQYVLRAEHGQWRWNTKAAARELWELYPA